MAAILAGRAGPVQTLLVAFSRQICCSRAMRVMNEYSVVRARTMKRTKLDFPSHPR